jgi:hypothetical protein
LDFSRGHAVSPSSACAFSSSCTSSIHATLPEAMLLHLNVHVKFVEVKGPRDQLSETQEKWLVRLHQCGIDAMECRIQEKTIDDTCNDRKKRKKRRT